jgi:hypothetical protein
MFQKMFTPIRLTAILSLVLMLSFSVVWAANKKKNSYTSSSATSSSTTSESTASDVSTVTYYQDSVTVPRGKKGNASMTPIKDGGQDKVEVTSRKYTLEPYMDEQGINEVTLTVDVMVEQIERPDGSHFYQFDFVFGPSGAFFEPEPLELTLKGKYHSDDTEVWLYDENGEAVEGVRKNQVDHTTFDIPHFSSYTYDFYDEY